MRRTLLLLAGVLAAWALPQEAWAGKDEGGRPFSKGTFQPSLGLGASFGGSLSVVNIGLGARYFVVGGLGPGLSISDTILIYDDQTRADFPGIEKQTPTNIVRVLPNLQWVFVRTRWFSPYVIGGVGPEFYNHGGGTVGAWMAGGGALIGLGGPVFVDLGVQFNGVFPEQQCRDAFTYQNSSGSVQLDSCSFTWGPRLGLTIAFGVGGNGGGKRRSRKSQPEPEPRPAPPPERAWEPPPEPVPVEPAEPVAPEPAEPVPVAPDLAEPDPVEPAPEGPEPAPDGPDEITAPPAPAPDAPTDIAAPPADAAPEPAPPPPE